MAVHQHSVVNGGFAYKYPRKRTTIREKVQKSKQAAKVMGVEEKVINIARAGVPTEACHIFSD